MRVLAHPRFLAAAAIAAGLLGAASAAQARSDVQLSIGLGTPVYSQPVYVAPQPVYVQPRPVYVQPEPVYVRPQPVYATPGVVYVQPRGWHDDDWRRREWRRHHEWERRHGRH